jgi:hypothetical protein
VILDYCIEINHGMINNAFKTWLICSLDENMYTLAIKHCFEYEWVKSSFFKDMKNMYDIHKLRCRLSFLSEWRIGGF